MRFTTSEIAAATAGSVVGPETTVHGAAIDSRTVSGGELFVPLVADRDGHDFVATALDAGAAAYLSSRPPTGGSAVVVADTMSAFTALGRAARNRLPDAVIGITGSVGKTSVKDLLAAVVATTFRSAASAKSFNNEIGIPLTLVNAPDDTEVLVQEMGARGVGHIAELCAIARPTTAVVTMVAEVHTSEFASLDAVAAGKGELVEAIPESGTAVLNADDDRVVAMGRRTSARVVTFGTTGDVRAESVTLDSALRPSFELRTPWGSTPVALSVHGVHQVPNALAAAAAGLVHDVPLEAVAHGLASASLSPWRMELSTTPTGATVINDAYNANPTAMAAALRSLAAIDARRKIAVVGLMAELGPVSAVRHAAIGALADELGVEIISVDCSAYGTGTDVADIDAALDAIGDLGDGDAVLVKASRSVGLEVLAARLTAR